MPTKKKLTEIAAKGHVHDNPMTIGTYSIFISVVAYLKRFSIQLKC